jgi:hypothetical protein
MQKTRSILSFFLFLFLFCSKVFAQDTTAAKMIMIQDKKPLSKKDSAFIQSTARDTLNKNKFNPHVAVVRSAIIPGWGQAYNKQYWKIPIVYGALGTTAGIFFYNLKYYKLLRKAYQIRLSGDTGSFTQVYPGFQGLSSPSIQTYRNEFRQNIDYSVLFFLFFWGLNVVDATVDAHLKAFDVSSDLSIEIKPGYSEFANTNGLSIVLNLDRKHMH